MGRLRGVPTQRPSCAHPSGYLLAFMPTGSHNARYDAGYVQSLMLLFTARGCKDSSYKTVQRDLRSICLFERDIAVEPVLHHGFVPFVSAVARAAMLRLDL